MTKLSQEISLQQFVLLITYLSSWLFGGVWLSKDFSSFFLFQISHSKKFCVSFLPRCIWYLSGSSLASIIYYSYSESTVRLIFLSFRNQGHLSLVKLPWLSGDCLEIHHIEIYAEMWSSLAQIHELLADQISVSGDICTSKGISSKSHMNW